PFLPEVSSQVTPLLPEVSSSQVEVMGLERVEGDGQQGLHHFQEQGAEQEPGLQQDAGQQDAGITSTTALDVRTEPEELGSTIEQPELVDVHATPSSAKYLGSEHLQFVPEQLQGPPTSSGSTRFAAPAAGSCPSLNRCTAPAAG
ncbi:unnamed protein product, partial [Amoebophrya sp. A25]